MNTEIEKNTIAAKIGKVAVTAERSTDVALVDAAEMLKESVKARLVLGLPQHEGQRGVIALGKAVNQLIGAQNELRRAHKEAKRVSDAFVLGPDSDDCPWPNVALTGESIETLPESAA